jgi:ElaB/YqjD/DUF883 family membrane-anchored ribosome-binding protein
MESLQLLKEIEAWLCFNTEPSKEEIEKLRKSINDHVIEQLNDRITEQLNNVSISLERAKKYARHQHYRGSVNKPLVEFEDWEKII